MNSSVNERQVGGNHYKTSLEHWDMLVEAGYSAEYFTGQISKYVSRWQKKNGLRDLLKAQHFLDKLEELLRTKWVVKAPAPQLLTSENIAMMNRYFEANDIGRIEAEICVNVVFGRSLYDIQYAQEKLRKLIAGAQDKADAEPPVALDWDFVRYGEDCATIVWKSKSTGEEVELPVDTPPGGDLR